MSEKMLLAVGQPALEELIININAMEIVGKPVEYRRHLIQAIEKENPTTVVVGDNLSGDEDLITLVLEVKKLFPKIRVIFFPGYVTSRDYPTLDLLSTLVHMGVYDIYHGEKVNRKIVEDIIKNPYTLDKMQYLYERMKNKGNKGRGVEIQVHEETMDSKGAMFNNVFTISSIKPGTGKSFLSTNVATAIAKYGKAINGKKPKVALIEADLQNLSIGTLLNIEDNKKNIATAFNEIATIVSPDGKLIGSQRAIEDVNHFVKSCFLSYEHVPNLYAIVGSNLKFNEVEKINRYHYFYLIKLVSEIYDYVIVDTNSSLTHVTTYPLLKMATECYYVLNLDYNNFRNNLRYQSTLKELNLLNKVKYILNEDVTQEEWYLTKQNPEVLNFTHEYIEKVGLELVARVPTLPKTVFLNRLFDGQPIILDDKDYTAVARLEILKVANEISTVDGIEEFELSIKNNKNKKRFFGLL